MSAHADQAATATPAPALSRLPMTPTGGVLTSSASRPARAARR